MMVKCLTMYMVQNPPKYDDVICEQPLSNEKGGFSQVCHNFCLNEGMEVVKGREERILLILQRLDLNCSSYNSLPISESPAAVGNIRTQNSITTGLPLSYN